MPATMQRATVPVSSWLIRNRMFLLVGSSLSVRRRVRNWWLLSFDVNQIGRFQNSAKRLFMNSVESTQARHRRGACMIYSIIQLNNANLPSQFPELIWACSQATEYAHIHGFVVFWSCRLSRACWTMIHGHTISWCLVHFRQPRF